MKKVNSDVAYEYIRRKILSGEFPPGHALVSEALSAQTKVSRTPVREALYQLRAEGLVSIHPRLGASVKTMNSKEFREMCELRLALEGHAAALAAANRTGAELREIEGSLEGMRRLTEEILRADSEEPFLSALSREDVRFHVGIMTAAKNDLMKKEILRLHLVNRVVAQRPAPEVFPDKAASDRNRRGVLISHEAIFSAIVARDVAASRAAMEAHIEEIIEKNLRAFAPVREDSARELTEEELAYSA